METSVVLKVDIQVDPNAVNPFEVIVVAETRDCAFRERMENLNCRLYFEERSLPSMLIRRRVFKFMFTDIVSISRLPNASPNRIFSNFQIFEGLFKNEFDNEQDAKSFANEVELYLADYYKSEYEHYLGLKEKDTANRK
ncbi:hypothetical protein ABER99_21785 [Paenibacillus glucanolyticus]|jgi:hypothetical protein|uniref:Uncharacterized protein n=1 Tax=Paenibacillus glucanolyticus TaxID=59843 RepID=A0A163GQI7_9BACL|nr:hypothetical protein [Paenibacillus glucanolyticus]KZS45093.1 hypothetical protein AWU65_03685 [Paenibacillus glucanolyticus]OMF65486.1 hypothetical protein BK142_30810 [Paenibacillus glucanolyticus]